MKQPKKITRAVREEILKRKPKLDVSEYLLVSDIGPEFILQNKITKSIISIQK